MRKLISSLLLAGFFVMALFSPGAAFTYEEPQPEGQVVKSYIGLAIDCQAKLTPFLH